MKNQSATLDNEELALMKKKSELQISLLNAEKSRKKYLKERFNHMSE